MSGGEHAGNETMQPGSDTTLQPHSDTVSRDAAQQVHLGAWSFYFLAKLALFWRQLIGFHPLENLAFAVFLLVPVQSRTGRALKTILSLVVGIALLYYDSWLPPIARALSQASLLTSFREAYLLELVGRFVKWQDVAMLVVGWAIYRLATRYVRVGFVVIVGLALLAAGVGQHNTQTQVAAAANTGTPGGKAVVVSSDPDTALRLFYAKEATRKVSFPKAHGDAPLDIIFIHICSLSWDDLRAVGLDRHPIFNSFDFVFRHFNSAASYSGPAAIRLNRAPCGQTSHKALYDPVPDQCYLMPSLKRSGFATALAFNHDGHFDDFIGVVHRQGVDAPLMPLDGVPVALKAFDDSPIYDDLGALSRWFSIRQRSNDPRVALFYNTISLHDGNHILHGPDASLSSHDNYKPRVEKLFDELTTFMDDIRKSGRRAIVVMIPEHGAAYRGDKYQIAGLREIPTPAITTVPVGIKIVGQDAQRIGGQVDIDAPSSYLAVSQLIARMIDKPPYGADGYSPADYAQDLATTAYVAANESTVMMQLGGGYYLKEGDDGWKPYTP